MTHAAKRFLTPEEMALKKIFRWVHKGGFAILDQGLFATSNFLISILLARWLSPKEYGAFAAAYSIFFLLAAYHTSILADPMLFYGSGKYAKDFKRYLGSLVLGHCGVGLLISVILAGVAGVCLWQGNIMLSKPFFGLAVASPFILALWLLRRAFYVSLQPHLSATGGALYLILMVFGAYGLFRNRWLSPFSGFVVMGAASILVSIWFLILLQPHWKFEHREAANTHHRGVLAEHWEYGRWLVAATFFGWLPGNIYYTLLPAFVGLEGNAALKALMNLIAPITQSNVAFQGLLVPKFVTTLKHQGEKGLGRLVKHVLALFVFGSLIYWLFIFLLGKEIIHWLYHGKYSGQTGFFFLMGALPLLGGIGVVIGSALRALKRPDRGFWCSVIASGVTLTLGLWLLMTHGTLGAVLGLLSSSMAGVAAGVYFYIAQGKREPVHSKHAVQVGS